MQDDRNKRGAKNHALINVREDHEVRYWTKELGVDQKTLTGAVKAVGPSLENVRQYLASQRPS